MVLWVMQLSWMRSWHWALRLVRPISLLPPKPCVAKFWDQTNTHPRAEKNQGGKKRSLATIGSDTFISMLAMAMVPNWGHQTSRWSISNYEQEPKTMSWVSHVIIETPKRISQTSSGLPLGQIWMIFYEWKGLPAFRVLWAQVAAVLELYQP